MAELRKRLSDILSDAQRKSFFADWDKVKAAGDYILPKGEYVALWIDGYAHEAKTGTKGYKLLFEILEGDHAGRKVFHDLWLTEAAKPQTKRNLTELGITDPERQLDRPIPPGVVVMLRVVIRKDDDGAERNRLQRFKFLRVQPGDAFAQEDADTTFDPGALEPKDEGMKTGAAQFPPHPNGTGPCEIER